MAEVLVLVAGFAVMVRASQRAVDTATLLAVGSNVPPFVIGLTLLAIGTDLPEIANSIASSVAGHGDINLGDSVGSAATQMTLVLGLLPLIVGTIEVPRQGIALTGACTVLGLAVLLGLLWDGHLGRLDALVLLSVWAGGSLAIHRRSVENHQLSLPEAPPRRGPLVVRLLLAFAVLAGGASVSLWAIVAISERFGAPEFLVGFFVAAIGTSLPELVFDVTALRRGAVAMAIGDIVGSSFVDATASVAVGPLVAPIDISRDIVARGTIVAMVAIALVTLIMARISRHDWRTGTILLGIYAAFFVAMLV